MNQYLNIAGLVFDIAGVILLFFHGLQPEQGKGYVESMPKKDLIRHKKYSHLALLLLIMGFLLQIFSSLLMLNLSK